MAVIRTVLLADAATAAGIVFGRIIGLAIAIALVIVGIRMTRAATTGGRRTLGIVLLVIGVLLVLGTVGSVSGGGTGTG